MASLLNNVKNFISSPVTTENDNAFYPTANENWFVAQPYGFKFTFSNNKSYVCFLPIAPSNITIRTNFATNMVPTLWGTVEEHSDVRYFDIQIDGTTGIAPKYVGIFETGDTPKKAVDTASQSPTPGRTSFTVGSTVPLGGFFSKTIGALTQIKNKASEAINGSDVANVSGIDNSQTGYAAFHILYKMLLRYKKDASGAPLNSGDAISQLKSVIPGFSQERTSHPIQFFNYKDGNQYNVVIRSFDMRRSADNPMLYYYSIQMRGYSLKGLDSKGVGFDQKQRLAQLGLDGVDGSSLLGDIKTRANAVKGVLGAAAGGINVLGR